MMFQLGRPRPLCSRRPPLARLVIPPHYVKSNPTQDVMQFESTTLSSPTPPVSF